VLYLRQLNADVPFVHKTGVKDVQNVRILLAGERDSAFPVLVRILGRASQSYEVIAQASGTSSVLLMLHEAEADIVLVDASGAEGIELCRQVTRNYPQVNVVLVGGRKDYAYLKRAMDAGAKGYISEDECTGEGIRREIDRIVQPVWREDEASVQEEIREISSGSIAVERVLKFIRNNYRRNISFSDAAEYAGISESHLRRCFRKKTGMSFVDFLTEYRIDAAKSLMRSENWPVARISEEAGFSSARYFCKVFKNATGKTPRDYMREVGAVKRKGEDT